VFDVYLTIHTEVDHCVNESIGRQLSDWRICHTCPACTYKLQDEIHLLFAMLWAMDGNDSFKCILHQLVNPETGERDGPSQEQADSRSVPGDLYIPWEDVNKWANKVVHEAMKVAEEVC
jgi:hypothetical protein